MTDLQTAPARSPRAALDTGAVIEQAKGIIMAGRRCTAEEAFAVLVMVAERCDRQPDDLADALVARVVRRPGKVR